MTDSLANDLFLLMLNLGQINEPERVVRLFIEAMSARLDGARLSFFAGERPGEGREPSDGGETLAVATSLKKYGEVALLNGNGLAASTRALIRNAVGMLALILENREQSLLLADEAARLDELAAKRGGELLDANRRLGQEAARRSRAQEELLASEQRLRGLFEANPIWTTVTTLAEGRFREANPAFFKVTGYTPEETIGKTAVEMGMWPDPAARPDVIREMQRKGELREYPVTLRVKDGELRDFLWYAQPLAMRGEPCMLNVLVDVSERLRAEEGLREREEKFRSLFDSMTELAVMHELVYDREGRPVDYRLLDCNPAFTRITGIERGRAVGALASELYGTGEAPYLKRYLPTAETGEPTSFEAHFEPMGKYFSISVSSPQKGRFITIASDVTEAKRAERERAILEGQLRQSHKMEALGTLAGGIAHDFNNILAAILGYAELLKAMLADGEAVTGEVDEIVAAAGRAKDLVKGILAFSRQSEVRFRPLDLNREVTRAVKMLERTIPRMVAIELNLCEQSTLVEGDAAQLLQVLLNLGSNAKDAMPEGGVLSLSTSQEILDEVYCRVHLEASPGRFIRLSVRDTGTGMPPDMIESIFDPFFTTKEVGRGTGLGLATVYGIVRSHGGHVTCYSHPGQGTVFNIYLPRVAKGAGEELGNGVHRDEPPGGDETVLVVDDEPTIRDLAQRILSRRGYKVLTAANGEEALHAYQDQGPVDVVLLDIGMPGMGGNRCLRGLLEADRKAKVIITSGYARTGIVERTLAMGAKGYEPKPFRSNELLNTLRRVLDAD